MPKSLTEGWPWWLSSACFSKMALQGLPGVIGPTTPSPHCVLSRMSWVSRLGECMATGASNGSIQEVVELFQYDICDYSWLYLFPSWLSLQALQVTNKTHPTELTKYTSFFEIIDCNYESKTSIFEGSLEVKLPTIWTDEKQRWEE